MQEEDQLESPTTDKPSPKKRGKWKDAEGHLTQKRQAMDKAKVRNVLSGASYVQVLKRSLDVRCGKAIFVPAGPNGPLQALRGYEGDGKFTRFCASLMPFIAQRARDPEYAAMLDAQPKPKGRGRKKLG